LDRADSVSRKISTLSLMKKSTGRHSLANPAVDVDALERLQRFSSGRNVLDPRDLYEQEEDERLSDRKLGSALHFELEDCSPYLYPLDGGHYDPDPAYGMKGNCPLCNNSCGADVDQYFLSNLHRRNAWGVRGGYRFSPAMVIEHLVNHVGLIYASALDIHERTGKTGQKERWSLESRVNAVIRSASVRSGRRQLAEREMEAMASFPSVSTSGQDPEGHFNPSIQGRPEGSRAKDWYAFDGARMVGALRPWEDGRVASEIAKRANEAIVFYDEMLDVRSMARRVYSEIMDTEPEEGQVRNYSAAIAAVREIKGVAMDMAKLALIATKFGDEKDRVRQISPSMKAMLDDIGIFENEDGMKQAETGDQS